MNTMTVDYGELEQQLAALVADEHDALANAANFVGLLFHALPKVNWLGIYVRRGSDLVLGPFQGKPACVRIEIGKGVCGAAAQRAETLRVEDVHEFEGHIACDPLSRSELVVPLMIRGQVAGVLDIDSPHTARFSAADQQGIERLCRIFSEAVADRGATASAFI
jgi:GAF domain-containing protein